jgi:hypothetical protein
MLRRVNATINWMLRCLAFPFIWQWEHAEELFFFFLKFSLAVVVMLVALGICGGMFFTPH